MIYRRVTYLYISIFVFWGAIIICGLFFDNSIRFSKPQGFYNEEFDLRIGTKLGVELYYTMDGSEPTRNSLRYTGPIHIYDASTNENNYSMEEEISVYFREDLTEKKSPHNAPDFKIDKCITLRVASFDKNGHKQNEAIQNYWIGFDNKEGYDDLYIISLVTDPTNLFNYEKGIYVNGIIFDQYIEKNGVIDGYRQWDTNYKSTGIESERPGYFSVFSPKRNMIFDSDCGLRIQGQGSRRLAQKSLGLTVRDEKTSEKRIRIQGIGDSKGVNKIKLFAGGQDNIAKLKDWLVSNIVKDSELDISTQTMIPSALFLNGEYWGTYYIVENYDEDYVYSHFGVNEDNVIIVKDGEIKEGTQEDKNKYYDNAREYIISHNGNENYSSIVDDYFDLESLIDYYALEIFIGNIDFYENFNTECWRSIQTDNGKYSDGKFRWMLYDVNYVDCLIEPDNIALKRCLKEHEIFSELMKDSAFREHFKERILYISRELFSEENIDSYVEPWIEVMKNPLEKSSMRFYGETNSDTIDEEIEAIKEYCKNREDILLEQLEKLED